MYQSLKQYVRDITYLNSTELHVLIGLALFAALMWLRRGPILSFFILFGLQFCNELLDIAEVVWSGSGIEVWEALEDTAWTMTLPALIACAYWVRSRKSTVPSCDG